MERNILYTFRRCPYAMRARWAILFTNLTVEWREVSLSQKPEELLEISPKATVPVLLTKDGKVIEESIEIMKWALQKNDKHNVLFSGDIQAQKQIKYILKTNDCIFKYHLDRYKYSDRFVAADKQFHKYRARQILLEWNEMLAQDKNSSWLVQGRESLADWAIWPFVRQYRIANPDFFDEDSEIELIKKWLVKFTEDPKFSILMLKSSSWIPGDKKKSFPPP
ncbi:glutathione S-transferase N-terminal domain-containing protein [Prochlorococcus sp. MIT 1307]|uniref:glutathione S-transferase N-terminal domain-containing protein n=1 Tax=Prochlorococcus sp. MIT 1307 TaxID=3096219 RepID=UPI002A75E00F|nr:glutathione S-transferase N-terminal domain-containing protein [Prochlorococcus sp. MIT 1307]